MKLNDWLAITNGRITEGSEFGMNCYGPDAYEVSYWNQMHGSDEISSHVVYDRKTFDVYEVEVYDGAREVTYVWRTEENRIKYHAELIVRNPNWEDDWVHVDLDTVEEFTAKATAIINGEDYDTKVSMPLDLPKDELFDLMMEAHRRDMTLNQLIEEALTAAIKKEEMLNRVRSRVTWTKEDTEDFVGLWRTIENLPVEDCSTGQFTGGVVSCTYKTPIYKYEAIWYNGDTENIPDEIVREKL